MNTPLAPTDMDGPAPSDPPMALHHARELARLAAPAPIPAGIALRVLVGALDAAEQENQTHLQTVTRLLLQLRDAAGLPAHFPLADLSQAITDLRHLSTRIAPLRAALTRCAHALADGHPARTDALRLLGDSVHG